jgi:hypothetical protein
MTTLMLSAPWFHSEPGYEPVLVALGSLTALLLTFFPESSDKSPQRIYLIIRDKQHWLRASQKNLHSSFLSGIKKNR